MTEKRDACTSRKGTGLGEKALAFVVPRQRIDYATAGTIRCAEPPRTAFSTTRFSGGLSGRSIGRESHEGHGFDR